MRSVSGRALLKRNVKLLYISYLIIFVMTLVLESIGSYATVKRIIYDNSKDLLNEFSISLEEKLQTGINLAIQLEEDNAVQQMALQNQFDYAVWSAGNRSLINYTNIYSRISSIYVYNAALNTIYTSTAIPGNDNLIVSVDQFSDQTAVDMIKKVYSYPTYTPIPRVVNFADGSIAYYFTVIGFNAITNTNSSREATELTMVNLSANYISTLSPSSTLQGELLIIDEDGMTVSNTSRYTMMTDLSEESFVHDISWEDSAGIVSKIEDETFYIVCSAPSQYGWKYYWLIPYGGIMNRLSQFWLLTAIIGSVLCFITLGLVSKLTFSINQPIQVIQNDLAVSKKSLQKAEQEHRENYYELRQNFLRDLLSGKILPSGYYSEQAEKFNFQFPFGQNLCLVLFRVVGRKSFMRQFNVREQRAVLFSACNIVAELMEKEYQTECIQLSRPGQFVCLSSPLNPEGNMSESLRQILPYIQQKILSSLGIELFCSVSSEGENLSDLPSLYRQALETDRYHLLTEPSDILFYSDCSRREDETAIYPESEYKKFQSALKDGQLEVAKSIYHEVRNRALNLSYQTIYLAVSHLSLSINMVIEYIRRDPTLNSEQLHIFSISLDQFENMREVDTVFFAEIELICGLTNRHCEKNSDLVEQIEQIVLRDFSSPSLCLDSISAEIGLSSNYLSRIYRAVRGISILNQITAVRMQEARELLSTSSVSIQDISERCGFTTLSYFYRIFKKENGITPAEYRTRNKNT